MTHLQLDDMITYILRSWIAILLSKSINLNGIAYILLSLDMFHSDMSILTPMSIQSFHQDKYLLTLKDTSRLRSILCYTYMFQR